VTSTGDLSVGRAAGRRTGRRVRATGIAAAAALIAVQLITPAAVGSAAWMLAVGGILIGVPHGAVDHLVPFWSTGRPITVAALAAVLGRYVTVLAVALAAVLVLPVPTLWVFLGAAALHFGRGEVMVAADFAGRPTARAGQDLLPALAHGAVTVGLPLGAWASVSLPALDRVAPGFAGTPPIVTDTVVIVTVALVVLAGVRLVRSGRPAEAGELLLLTALFGLVPPLAAFGAYFGLWHAARHTLRLVSLPGPDGAVDVRAGAVRYLRGAAAPTVAAALLLLILLQRGTGTLLTAELALLVGLTAPHLGSVAALDRQVAATARQGCHGPQAVTAR
jgi:Brp/Blh family beta-carotene 15,15'-monooxygenase